MISLKSENQLIKKFAKELRNQKVNISKSMEANLDNIKLLGDENNSNKINHIFEVLNGSLNNYYYSYGIKNNFIK